MIGQFLARFGVETWAIRPADRLERQCQHYRIPHDGFEIHVIISNREVESFIERIREKLLEFDSERDRDGVEAAYALPHRLGDDLGADEDALVQALELDVDLERCSLFDDRGTGAELLGGADVEGTLAHLTGAMHEIAHVEVERVRCGRHER